MATLLAINIDGTINSDGAAVNDTAVNERKRGWHKVPPNKGLSREGPCGEGGNPPYNDEYNIGHRWSPIGLLCITRMYTERWNPSERTWQTWHSDHNCHMEQSQKGRASTLVTDLPEKEDDEKRRLEASRKNGQVRSLTSNEETTTVVARELNEPQGSSLSQETVAKTDNERARSLTRNRATTRVVI